MGPRADTGSGPGAYEIWLKLEKMWCGYFDGNEKSKRVQEKCGFRYHHTKENVPCAIEGLLRTEHITCITREEWLKSNK